MEGFRPSPLARRGGGFSAVMASFLAAEAMGVLFYLAMVGGGLTAAFLATVVLKGVRLI